MIVVLSSRNQFLQERWKSVKVHFRSTLCFLAYTCQYKCLILQRSQKSANIAAEVIFFSRQDLFLGVHKYSSFTTFRNTDTTCKDVPQTFQLTATCYYLMLTAQGVSRNKTLVSMRNVACTLLQGRQILATSSSQ